MSRWGLLGLTGWGGTELNRSTKRVAQHIPIWLSEEMVVGKGIGQCWLWCCWERWPWNWFSLFGMLLSAYLVFKGILFNPTHTDMLPGSLQGVGNLLPQRLCLPSLPPLPLFLLEPFLYGSLWQNRGSNGICWNGHFGQRPWSRDQRCFPEHHEGGISIGSRSRRWVSVASCRAMKSQNPATSPRSTNLTERQVGLEHTCKTTVKGLVG